MSEIIHEIKDMLKEARNTLLSKKNVVATGIGYKTTNGKKGKNISIICSVDHKSSTSSLSKKDIIPKDIDGFSTDVLPVGTIRALSNTGRMRPAKCGGSIGHYQITAGTLGCLVKKNNSVFILSNNHVLANSNEALIGDAILQPGPYDGGHEGNDIIANLSYFEKIKFIGENIPGVGDGTCPVAKSVCSVLNGIASIFSRKTRLQVSQIEEPLNKIDAALAKPLEDGMVSPDIIDIGAISGQDSAMLGMPLKKSGRTTGLTTGTVDQIDVTARVNYGTTKVATFENQIMAGAMSQGGDSGSAVLSEDNKIIGLLFAGSNTVTIMNRIEDVVDRLQIQSFC